MINAHASLLYRFHPSAGLPPSLFQTKCKKPAGRGRGKELGSLSAEGKRRSLAGGAPGWIGIGRWLSPDFWFSPFQGGNPVINAHASLLYRFRPSAGLPPSLFQIKCKKPAGRGRGKELGSLCTKVNTMGNTSRFERKGKKSGGAREVATSLHIMDRTMNLLILFIQIKTIISPYPS